MMRPSTRQASAFAFVLILLSSLHSAAVAADLTFAVFGDCRPGKAAYSPVMQKLAAAMAQDRPAFALGTGDYIQGSSKEATVREQWAGFFTALAPLQAAGPVPVGLAPGNHDIVGSRRNQAIYEEYFRERYRSFNHGPYHFVLLDTEEPGLEGRIAGKQRIWLKADLAEHRQAQLTFVALHRPLYPTGPHKGSSMDVNPTERDGLHRIFQKEGVDCVFHGHEHLYHREQRDGVDYVITGGAGAPLYATPDRGGFYHYLLVQATGTRYSIQVKRLGKSGASAPKD